MKKTYRKPMLETYAYRAEAGYAVSVALAKDYVLVEGDDRSTLRVTEKVTEITDDGGGYLEGTWD